MTQTKLKNKTTIREVQIEPPLDYSFWIALPIFLSLVCLALPGQIRTWMLTGLSKVSVIGAVIPQQDATPNTGNQTNPQPQNSGKSAFQIALKYTLDAEGGCDNDPRDPGNAGGGYTCKGVTQEAYNRFFQGDVRNMTQEQLEKIYYEGYWLESGADKFPMPLAAIIFDVAVNSGPGTSDKLWAEVKDSVANKDPKEQALALLQRREAFYKGINNPTFEQGWLNRNNRFIELVKDGSLNAPAVAQSPQPNPSPSPGSPQPDGSSSPAQSSPLASIFGTAPTANPIERAKQATVTIYNGSEIGSGSIISTDGKIVTNCHVIRGGGSITVKLAGGERLSASRGASDCSQDLALIQIQSSQTLPTIPLATVDPAPANQSVTIIGAPFGKSGTVTTGTLQEQRNSDLVVSSGTINPGNSGGPLLDSNGQMIGVVRALDERTGQGIARKVSVLRQLAGAK